MKIFESMFRPDTKALTARLFAIAALVAGVSPAFAQSAPSLGTASSFAALSGAGLTCTGSGVVGDVGSLLSVTGFPPPSPALCSLIGTVHAADATAIAAHDAVFGANGAYSALAAQACNFNHAATEQLSGQTLASGVHCFPSTALLNGPLPLNLVGNGPWIFRLGSALTTGATSPAMASVLVDGQASCGAGVFWQVGTATIGANTAFVGNILATTAISFTGTNSSLVGRAFANTAAVTMTGTKILASSCGATPPPPHSCDKHDKREKHGKLDRHDRDDKHDKHDRHDKKDRQDKQDCDKDDGDHDDDGHHGDEDKDRGDKNPFGGSHDKKRN